MLVERRQPESFPVTIQPHVLAGAEVEYRGGVPCPVLTWIDGNGRVERVSYHLIGPDDDWDLEPSGREPSDALTSEVLRLMADNMAADALDHTRWVKGVIECACRGCRPTLEQARELYARAEAELLAMEEA